MTEKFSFRVDAQLRLALLAGCGCQKRRALLEADARRAGLTGAEIDAAARGRSFDARTAIVLEYARTLIEGGEREINRSRLRAARLGLDAEDLAEVENKVARILSEAAADDL
ncbi:MAG: hypothetical protein FP825_05065 [Hyphomonas sp.]|uniref:hypothetical protein n=1 Tax=Hyphomonas sp. TaxID=87 RepID=UPI00180EBE6B|nr:hypothetical protein [Hyphomonas sp.]MBA3067837.1 hypothetical protein [Hyphomonas sp.]MBU3919946.1 hypothetical protein [Alphaproteobacteria bacterium]MBU4062393.1 hypothetical protein [Alphaproteobacteria bacterium]MBU4165999.1 hypothetical protein [Alphaproteobacteria bacterium]